MPQSGALPWSGKGSGNRWSWAWILLDLLVMLLTGWWLLAQRKQRLA